MNYYERIQQAIDYIENHLEDPLDLDVVARQAYMSKASFYRLFFALAGFTVKEYIRRRRLALAFAWFQEGQANLLDLAIRYDFESHAAFSRAFKRITGYPPSTFRRLGLQFQFERIDLMDQYFEIQDAGLLEKYPDIKVLKEIGPFRVAAYRYWGREPENGAFAVIRDWLNMSGLDRQKDQLRIFGFNNPSPSSPGQTEYGYEVWVTLDAQFAVADPRIQVKTFAGGLYAVCGVKGSNGKDFGAAIVQTWQRFNRWLKDSKYTYGNHQWLEEHLGFNDAFEHTGGMDLYMPIVLKDNSVEH